MKVSLASLIGGNQLTGEASALAAGESSVFASLLGGELASSDTSAGWKGLRPGQVSTGTQTGDAATSNQIVTSNDDFLAGLFVPTNTTADNIVVGLDVAVPQVSAEAVSNGEAVTANDGLTGDVVADIAASSGSGPEHTAQPAASKTAPVEAAIGQKKAEIVTSQAGTPFTQETAAQSAAGEGLTENTQAVETSDAEGVVPELAETAQKQVKSPEAQLIAQVATSQPEKPSNVTTGLQSEDLDAEAESLIASVSSSAGKSTAATARKTDVSSGSASVPTANSQTAQPSVNPQTASVSAQANTPSPENFTLLPDTDGDLILTDTDLQSDADMAISQTVRADARSVEAAAQQAVRGSNAPQMAALVSRIGEQFLERFNGKSSSFEIRLDPPELGKVDIRVEVGADGKVMAVLAARDPSVVDALMRGARTLENVLTQAGLSLDEGGIQVELDQQGTSSFAETYSDEFADEFAGSNAYSGEDLAEAGDDTPITPVIETWSRQRLNLTA